MNTKNAVTKFRTAAASVGNKARNNVVPLALVAMTAAPSAFAQAADFDPAEILTKVVTYTAIGITILGAFALGRWTLRAMGLIGGTK